LVYLFNIFSPEIPYRPYIDELEPVTQMSFNYDILKATSRFYFKATEK